MALRPALDKTADRAHREPLKTPVRLGADGDEEGCRCADVLRHLRPPRLPAAGSVAMATTAAHGRHGRARGWWSRYWNAVRGRETWVAAPADELDTSVSFAELVWAHYQRQEEVYTGKVEAGAWEAEYRRRLKRFKQEHGEIRKDYWCRYQASGV